MKFQINKEALSSLINTAQRAISNRTNMQILEGIHMIAKDNQLILKATDTELSVCTQASCMVEEEGEIIVQSGLFGEIVRKLPNAMIHIHVEDKKIYIECEQSSFEIMGQNAEEYPDLPQVNGEESLTIAGDTLIQAFKQTVFATSTDDMRIALTGVLMDIQRDKINFVALDGYRMALRKVPGEFEFERKAILPGRSVQELIKLIREEKDEVPIYFGHNHIRIDLDDTQFYTKLLSGEFFQYEGLIRDQHQLEVQVVKREFQDSLERANLLTGREHAGLVKINIHSDEMVIESNSEIGNVHEELPCHRQGDDLLIAFNAKYLLEGIRVIDEDSIDLFFTDAINPCIIHPAEDKNYLYLVLPVRLAG